MKGKERSQDERERKESGWKGKKGVRMKGKERSQDEREREDERERKESAQKKLSSLKYSIIAAK